MSVSPSSDDGNTFATVGIDAPDLERVDSIVLENEDVLIFDVDEQDAWIQSDDYIRLEMML
jgi:hypothetical protein